MSVVADINGLIPLPASLEKNPRLIPQETAEPTIPPKTASYPNALAKIEPNIPGTFPILSTIIIIVIRK